MEILLIVNSSAPNGFLHFRRVSEEFLKSFFLNCFIQISNLSDANLSNVNLSDPNLFGFCQMRINVSDRGAESADMFGVQTSDFVHPFSD